MDPSVSVKNSGVRLIGWLFYSAVVSDGLHLVNIHFSWWYNKYTKTKLFPSNGWDISNLNGKSRWLWKMFKIWKDEEDEKKFSAIVKYCARFSVNEVSILCSQLDIISTKSHRSNITVKFYEYKYIVINRGMTHFVIGKYSSMINW